MVDELSGWQLNGKQNGGSVINELDRKVLVSFRKDVSKFSDFKLKRRLAAVIFFKEKKNPKRLHFLCYTLFTHTQKYSKQKMKSRAQRSLMQILPLLYLPASIMHRRCRQSSLQRSIIEAAEADEAYWNIKLSHPPPSGLFLLGFWNKETEEERKKPACFFFVFFLSWFCFVIKSDRRGGVALVQISRCR